MKTTLPSSSQTASLLELRRLEEFLAAKLENLHRSGRQSDSRFLCGLEGLHEVLSLGLSSLRASTEPPEPARPAPRPTMTPVSNDVDVSGELELAEDEFLLDFGEEIVCLEASRELPEGFLPTRLRQKDARPGR